MGEWLERLPDSEAELLTGAGYAQLSPVEGDLPTGALAFILSHWMGPDDEVEWVGYLMEVSTGAAIIAALYESARRTGQEAALIATVDQLRALSREIPI